MKLMRNNINTMNDLRRKICQCKFVIIKMTRKTSRLERIISSQNEMLKFLFRVLRNEMEKKK